VLRLCGFALRLLSLGSSDHGDINHFKPSGPLSILNSLKPLISALRPHPFEFITLNSPMVYQPGTTPFGDSIVTHPTWNQPAEHLKCWWNASDDEKEYLGWEASVRVIERVWIEKGSWDDIVAFSQGAM
jgi:hypothetical protein